VEDVLEAIVQRIPPPKGSAENPFQALVFDSWFDIYRGAVVLVRVMEGRITRHMKIRLVATNEVYEVEQLGTLTPKPVALDELEAGDVGFIVANICPMKPSGVQLISPIVPPGRQTRTNSSAAR